MITSVKITINQNILVIKSSRHGAKRRGPVAACML